MRPVRTSKDTPICMATSSATTVSAGFHHLRTIFILSGSFADCSANEKPLEDSRASVDRVQHPAPACACREMGERVKNADQPLDKRRLCVVAAGGVHRPINKKWPAHNRAAVDKTPVATVRAAIAVVAHGE